MTDKKITWKLVMEIDGTKVGEYKVPYDYALKALMAQAEPYKKGNLTAERRLEVLERDNYQCLRCGAKHEMIPLQVHHILPEVHGGTAEMNNLVTLCWKCHQQAHKTTFIGDASFVYEGKKQDYKVTVNELESIQNDYHKTDRGPTI